MSLTRLGLAPVFLVALLPLLGCPKDDEILTHGVVKLEMRVSANQDGDPYVGTATATITMTYRECLRDFYTANPDLRQEGREGELIFGTEEQGGEGWADRLCESGPGGLADCTVAELRQQLDVVQQLTITYGIGGALIGRTLQFGPVPTAETAGCPNPVVRFASAKGYDGAGNEIWSADASSLDAITGQGAAIDLRASRND